MHTLHARDVALPLPAGAATWRRLPVDVDAAAAQIVRSTALAGGQEPLPALRWYWATAPALILGVFQNEALVNGAACQARSIPVLRRRSGGTGVLAGPPLLSLDIALPPGHPLALADVTESYRWLGEAWLATVTALGVHDARLVSIAEVRAAAYHPPRRPAPEMALSDEDLVRLACFGGLSPYEVAIGPRKLVGFSQVRRRQAVLFQVGLPLTWQAGLLSTLLAVRPADGPRLERLLRARAVGLDEIVPAVPPAGTIIERFEQVLAARWGVRLVPAPTSDPASAD